MTGDSAPWSAVAAAIARATGERMSAPRVAALGGGCINRAFRLDSGERRWFVKLNSASRLSMFEAEAAGLDEILASGTLRAPRPVATGVDRGDAFIVLEYLELGGAGRGGPQRLGAGLAAMHRHTAARFGWHRDNTIGSTPQINTPADDWLAFWRRERLGYQLALAEKNGFGGRLQSLGEQLTERCAALFADYRPLPALLHGDLWGGNAAYTVEGEPVVFDPAVYYGDREADLAMTELFGGFGAAFYAAYREAYPLDPGYAVRKAFYNLYHVLNHANLFGGGYAGQAEGMMQRLLAEI
ncbi:MAG TPA: fructosamine kinase family protein [Pelomicrobium sp.]|nr:fructosamine kinase family protein [Pelomicrobium sp.]